jgi:pimeloyl-ACP methyl ester carboxylesterase
VIERGNFTFRNLRLSYLEASPQQKQKLFIAHANGYAAGMYDYLIEELSRRYHVCALDFAGHGESESTLDFSTWNFFRDQILAFFAHKGWQKVTAIGHSLGGGSLLRAAQVDSGVFEKIIAFDPVILNFAAVLYVKLFGNPMADTALARRSDFKNKEQALKVFLRHPSNRSWQRASVEAYVKYCIRDTGEKAELCCSPAVEAQIFSLVQFGHLFKLGRITCETHFILPPKSHVCPMRIARRVVRNHPNSTIDLVSEGGHLLPFENHRLTLSLVGRYV